MAEKKILDNQVDLSAYDTAAQAAQKVAAAVETGDEQTLAAAKSYADTQNAATLASAKEYTAEEIGKLNFVKFVETLPQTGESKYIYAVVQEERTPDDEAIVLLFVWTGTEWAASGVMAGAVDASVFQPYIDACQAAQTAAQTAQTGAESARDAAEEAKDAAVSAQTAAESAQSAAETAKGQAETFASSAQTSATAAETSADSADTFAQAASSSQQAAAGSATAASASADLAQAWAVKTDGAVADGEYSAKYHAQQAATSATAADGFASTATTQATNAAGSAELAQKWATQMDSEVAENQGYGAKKYAQDAASSASGAAASAAVAAAAADQAADKVQTDLSNVSASGQKRAGAWALPNYSAGVSMGSGVQKAPADGWVSAHITGPNDGRNRGIRVGTSESPNLEIFYAGGVGINTLVTRILFPVKKDWYYGPTGGCSVESAIFFPL